MNPRINAMVNQYIKAMSGKEIQDETDRNLWKRAVNGLTYDDVSYFTNTVKNGLTRVAEHGIIRAQETNQSRERNKNATF